MLIDTHAHIYDQQFETDLQATIDRSLQANVRKILMPNCAAETIDAMLQVEKKYPNICFAMMGLHPCYVKNDFEKELAIVDEWFTKRKFIAVGEIGLDYHWDLTFVEQQKIAFEHQIILAKKHKIPVVIHSRNATKDCIEIIQKHADENLTGEFHCFSGSVETASAITELGFYLGIGGVVTYKKSGLDELLQNLSLDNIILETDAPYLAPVPFRGKRNECAYIENIAVKIAGIKKMPFNEVAEITTVNAKKLFQLQ